MRQITQNYKTGKITLEDLEVPALKTGGVLVRTNFSVISSGTEAMKVKEGKLSYLGKALARPDQVKKLLHTVQQQGFMSAYQKAMNKLDSLTPLGYSLSGEVVAVGAGAEEFHIGQRVACAGAGYANHAELNWVPKNLTVPVPDSVAMKHAAFVTVGAIALHGFRQGGAQLGESACVIGLGLLGQLLVQILRAAGVYVIGIDLVEERCRLARELGATVALTASDPVLDHTIARLSGGHGVDTVFIAASGTSNAATEIAVRIARDRARVVDIGKTRLDLPWNDYYLKEMEVRFSRSYGPGRYDSTYEEKGVDYPIGYVRWTERRNLSAFLALIADGKIRLDPIVSSMRPFTEAENVYREISEAQEAPLCVVFEYSGAPAPVSTPPAVGAPALARRRDGELRLGVIGAGNYGSSMLLPHLCKLEDVTLTAVATTSSLSAENARRKFGFKQATTSYRQLLEDENIDAVMILTRHASHASLVSDALRAQKAVYVEKPLAISAEQLREVRAAMVESGNDRLMVGFNRRFSPAIQQLAQHFRGRAVPLVLHYRVHAGQLEKWSWYLDPSEGSRFVGEAGHFLDVFSYLTDSRPIAVSAATLRPEGATTDDRDNMVATVRYENGSIGNLLYLTQGGMKISKESLEIFGGGTAAQCDNFEMLRLYENAGARKIRLRGGDKGQQQEMRAFVAAAKGQIPMPFSAECLFDTSAATLAAAQAAQTGESIAIAEIWEE